MSNQSEAAVKTMAELLCEQNGTDPYWLEPGNLAPMIGMDKEKFQNGEYDDLFDDGTYPPDGRSNGGPAMYMWRRYIFKAQEVLALFEGGA